MLPIEIDLRKRGKIIIENQKIEIHHMKDNKEKKIRIGKYDIREKIKKLTKLLIGIRN